MDRGEILEEASKLTQTDRQRDYGTPRVNHDRIANLWSAYLERPITAEQVAICLALVKISRTMQSKKIDNYIDGAAYFAIAGELSDE